MTRGRKKGKSINTRNKIMKVALSEFSDLGYDQISMRQIARRAEVDPALIYHYFDGKEHLFIEIMRNIVEKNKPAERITSPVNGQYIVSKFLKIWGGEDDPSPLVGLLKSINSTSQSVKILNDFIYKVITPYVSHRLENGSVELYVSLIASQLFGLMLTRYILKLEAISSLSMEEVSGLMGPSISQIMDMNISAVKSLNKQENGDKD